MRDYATRTGWRAILPKKEQMSTLCGKISAVAHIGFRVSGYYPQPWRITWTKKWNMDRKLCIHRDQCGLHFGVYLRYPIS